MLSVTKRFEFSAAHHLLNHGGRCKNPHGHNFSLEVEVSGSKMWEGQEKGMIIDFGKLKKIVNEYIIDVLDHTYLNDKYENPTAEEMVEDIAWTLLHKISDIRYGVVRVRLYETPDSYAEWTK